MLNQSLTWEPKIQDGERIISSINGAGKLDIHNMKVNPQQLKHKSESPKVKKTVCSIPSWGPKMFATFIGNNVDIRGLFRCISQFIAIF